MFEGFSQEELETYAAFLGRVIQNEERYYHNLSQKDNP